MHKTVTELALSVKHGVPFKVKNNSQSMHEGNHAFTICIEPNDAYDGLIHFRLLNYSGKKCNKVSCICQNGAGAGWYVGDLDHIFELISVAPPEIPSCLTLL